MSKMDVASQIASTVGRRTHVGTTAHINCHPFRIHRWLKRCDHAVLNDTTILSDPEFKHYFYQQLGQYNQLYVYTLHAQ